LDNREGMETVIDGIFGFGKFLVDGARSIGAKNIAKVEPKPEPKKQEVPTLPVEGNGKVSPTSLPPFLRMESVKCD